MFRRLIPILLAAGFVSFPGTLAAASESPTQWTLTAVSRSTDFSPSAKPGEDVYVVTLTNTGGASSDGKPIVITDELPRGLALDARGASGENPLSSNKTEGFDCVLRTCTYSGVVVPDQTLDLTFPVDVLPEAIALSPLTNVVRVSGGGAPVASVSTPTVVSETPASFGISPGGVSTALSSVQAGAHPDITSTVAFNTSSPSGSLAGDPKDVTYHLPPGFASDFVDTPTCQAGVFLEQDCSMASQIGITTVTIRNLVGEQQVLIAPVYSLAPGAGQIAKLGFFLAGNFGIQGAISLRPSDYGADVSFTDTNEGLAQVLNVSLTVWGVPADPIHDPLRALPDAGGGIFTFGHSSDAAPVPFFTNPTSCDGVLESGYAVNSWERPEQTVEQGMPFGPIVGCDRLGMEPSLTAEVTTLHASAPTGLDVATKIPQTYEDAEGLATSTLRKEVVTLPEGMTVNPSSGAGLQACGEAQYAAEAAQYVAGVGCPVQSRLASVEIVTPALSEHVKGSLFLAEPAPFGEAGRNPFKSLLALYLIARIPDRGVLVKSAGLVEPNLQTGQLVTTFDNLPPLPFSLATFGFNQGANAPIVTPPTCGSYRVTAQLTPYSDPQGLPLQPLIPPFSITQGAGEASPCPGGGAPPFAPQAVAGTQNNAAGSYSPLYLRLSRADGEQELTGFSSQLPPGLTANLSGVPFCPEAAIQLARERTGAQEETEPACPAASQIGHTIAEAGVGKVLAQAPGKLYMAGPFQGAPFSVVAITSAKVGPFDLGTVVVQLPLQIDPTTAVVTIPAGAADQIPHIIKGIVIHVRNIRVYVDRQDFTLNPTNCDPMSFAVTLIGSGQSFVNPADDDPVTVRAPFQDANCASLGFKPTFKVSTTGKTSRKNGASLAVKLTYPNTPQGTQANIRSVKVDLPRQLPSRLTTLQKACTVGQFDIDPAGCPAASIVGHATARTPILPVPLTGPAYFVSHGGAKFPELVVVLQGYGFTIDLHGETFINKAGITSSTFRTVPDQPVTSFELTLPQGPNSALAANGNLCAAKLKMPTVFTAQNGATVRQSTPIGVSGCPKKKAKKARRRAGS